MFINAFLGLAATINGAAVTECAVAGYGRQPISFSVPKSGECFNAVPYNFGVSAPGMAGRAIWDAPTGGNLLLIMPFPSPVAQARMARDFGDVGYLRLVFTDMLRWQDGAAYIGTFGPNAVVGTTNDLNDGPFGPGIVSGATGTVGGGVVSPTYIPQINTAQLTAPSGLSIGRGILQTGGTGVA